MPITAMIHMGVNSLQVAARKQSMPRTAVCRVESGAPASALAVRSVRTTSTKAAGTR